MLLLLFVAPACLTTLLYNVLNHEKQPVFQSVLCTIVFAYFINLLMYVVFWLWGFEYIRWVYDGHLGDVAFCLKVMVLSLVFAGLLAALATGVKALLKNYRVSKRDE